MRVLPEPYEDDDVFSPILCPYKGVPREVHPAACQWHQDERDPECKNCKRYKRIVGGKNEV
jgi:hypothetical protein